MTLLDHLMKKRIQENLQSSTGASGARLDSSRMNDHPYMTKMRAKALIEELVSPLSKPFSERIFLGLRPSKPINSTYIGALASAKTSLDVLTVMA